MTKRDQHTNDPALGHPDGDDDRGDAGADDADDHGDDADDGGGDDRWLFSEVAKMRSYFFSFYQLQTEWKLHVH